MNYETARRKAEELVSKMTAEEKMQQLLFNAPAIERLGIKNFDNLLSEMIDFAGNVANDMGDMTGL